MNRFAAPMSGSAISTAARVNGVLRELSEEAISFVAASARDVEPVCECTAYMRYVGQGWEIPVGVDIKTYDDSAAGEFRARFSAAYVALFGREIDGLDVEIVSWSLRASSPPEPTEVVDIIAAGKAAEPVGKRRLFEAKTGNFVDAGVYQRSDLAAGSVVAGPAAIIEAETTTIVSTAFSAVMQRDGCLLLRAKSATPSRS